MRVIKNLILSLAIAALTIPAASAQDDDSASVVRKDTFTIITARHIDELSKQAIACEIDTGILSFHYYNPVYEHSFAFQFLGNTGSAFQNNIFSDRNSLSPFVFANPYLVYFHDPYKRLHFNTHRPFTEISYVTAGNKETSEQLLSALHTQNVNRYTNIGIDYDLIASKGLYLTQEAKSNRFTIFGSYDRDNYSVFGNITSNRAKAQENGGLVNIPAFIDHPSNDPIAYLMMLDNASSGLKNLTVFATQSYRFKKTVTDTASVKKEKDLPFMVNHTLRYDRYTRLYNDEISDSDTLNFYAQNYYSLNAATDSAFRQILENSVQISGDEYKFLPGFIIGTKHQYTGYSYLHPQAIRLTEGTTVTDTILPQDFSTSYNNLSLFAMLLFNKKTRVTYEGKFEYFFAGYRLNDILTDFTMNYKLNPAGALLTARGKFYATEPDFFLKHYYSSHFQWNTAFPKTTTTAASLSLASGDGTIYAEAGVSLLGNYIWLNDMAIPDKAENTMMVSSLRVEKKFNWGGFHHNHKFILQKVNHEEYLHLPLLAYSNTSYYENAFFKDVLKFQLGFDLYINTPYYADAYMPATGMFYSQENRKTGGYPYLDGFFNWKVKRTRFFLKYTNSLAGLAGNDYFTTYGYPMNPRSLKFGLAWDFYN
jgi:hypothetical protein